MGDTRFNDNNEDLDNIDFNIDKYPMGQRIRDNQNRRIRIYPYKEER